MRWCVLGSKVTLSLTVFWQLNMMCIFIWGGGGDGGGL